MARPARRPRSAPAPAPLDADLAELPAAARWRTQMGRVEALIFAATRPVSRDDLAALVGDTFSIEALVEDIRAELRGRPYDIVAVAGGWQFRTRPAFADVLRAAPMVRRPAAFTAHELQVLAGIAWHQPVTRGELCALFGRDIGRDILSDLRADGLIVTGPRSPRPGAPATYVTAEGFLERFGLDSLHELPELNGVIASADAPDDHDEAS
jgi:segregation and condensation protein B